MKSKEAVDLISFTPITTFQGLSQRELKDFIQEKSVYIWGGGELGWKMAQTLKRQGFLIKGFCDSSSVLQNSTLDEFPVYSPDYAITRCLARKSVLILAVGTAIAVIEGLCREKGLVKNVDYITYYKIQRPEVEIRIGDEPFMNISTYKKVFDKLILEIPNLFNINFSGTDPLFCVDLAQIIKYTNSAIPCTVITSFGTVVNLDKILESAPNVLQITVQNYSDEFVHKLCYLKECVGTTRSSSKISVVFHLSAQTTVEDKINLEYCCKRLGFAFYTDTAYLFPFEKYIEYCKAQEEKRNVRESLMTELDLLPWDYKKCLEICRQERGKPCLCQRIFPVINADISIALCHIYNGPKIVDNYLTEKIEDVIDIRNKQEQCFQCQKYGIHRLDLDVLERKYPGIKNGA